MKIGDLVSCKLCKVDVSGISVGLIVEKGWLNNNRN